MPSLWRGIRSGIEAYRQLRLEGATSLPRTERDAPMQWVGIALIVSVIPLFFVFRYVAGEPAVYRSSESGRREFCPACGSQLAFRDADGVSLNTGCLDDPDAMPPAMHIWCESRVAWFETADDLPRHARDATEYG